MKHYCNCDLGWVNEVSLRDSEEKFDAVVYQFNENKILMILIKKGHKDYVNPMAFEEWYKSGEYLTTPPNIYLAITLPHLEWITQEYHPVKVSNLTVPIFKYNMNPTSINTRIIEPDGNQDENHIGTRV